MKHPLYDKLFELSKHFHLLSSLEALAEWDQETYMPKEAIEQRSLQAGLLAHYVHKSKTSNAFAKTLDALIDIQTGEIKESRLSPPQMAALREWRKDYVKAVKLPAAFVRRFANTVSTASHVWKTAKEHNDFKTFAPHLEKVISLCRKKADILGFQEHPYDALLDLFEPDMKTSYLITLFEKLKLDLKELLRDIMSKPQKDDQCLYRECPKDEQVLFCKKILHKMGFDEASARLDLSVHPFCTGMHPKDTRMTIKVNPENLFSAVFAALHEGGHGLYNRGLPAEQYGSPLCEAISLGIDESQSRFWETVIGQSEAFWHYFFPILQREFPEQFQMLSFDKFFAAINLVQPGLIRIESDEVTYNLHIIVRFEIEKGLIEGKIKVKDLPDIWNEKMRDNLGISPQYNREGCMQDIHWSLGFFGYFPTYTLGNLYAAQFFNAFAHAHPNWKERLAAGDLDFIREWLRSHIHQYGRQYTSDELCSKVTGRNLSEKPFIDYLNRKYKALYGIQAALNM